MLLQCYGKKLNDILAENSLTKDEVMATSIKRQNVILRFHIWQFFGPRISFSFLNELVGNH